MLNRHLTGVTKVVLPVLAAVIIAGCGQKGDLYAPEDAPANTKFLLYVPPVTSTTDSTNNAEATIDDLSAEERQQLAEILADPQDY